MGKLLCIQLYQDRVRGWLFDNYNENFGILKRWGSFIVLVYISLSRTLFQLLSYCHARKMYGGMDV
jgi:hypothetical protein